jgi:hypothetical protein
MVCVTEPGRLGNGPDGSGSGAWAPLDARVTRAAALGAFEGARRLDVVSGRVSGYQFNPVHAILLHQLSVR